jgi:hypothetical protein
VRREVHESIGGFDETVVLAEDHEYVQRASQVGKFRILRGAPMPTSMRRIEKEGLVSLAFKYLYSELYVVTGRPVKEIPFEYEFAAFDGEKRQPVRIGIDKVRERLATAVEPIERLSADGMQRLRALGNADVSPEAIEPLLRDLTVDEMRAVRAYMSRRLDRAKRMGPIVVWRIRRRGDDAWKRLSAEVRRR